MSYDVTFHCISKKEIQRYVFDILEHPGMLQSRAAEVSSDSEVQEQFLELFNEFIIPWYMNESTPSGDPITAENFAAYFSFAIASVAGFLHPYWYARNSAICFLAEKIPSIHTLFQSFSALENSPLAKFDTDTSILMSGNYSASGVLQNVGTFKGWVLENQNNIAELIDEDGLDSLLRALNYCIDNGLYLIEATEIVVPISGECQSNYGNLRAHFLKNIDSPAVPRTTRSDEHSTNSCKKCGSAIGFIDVFKAGLPTMITCGKCGSYAKFNINPYIDYPILICLLIAFAAITFVSGDYLITNQVLPFKEKYIFAGTGITFAVIFEILFGVWLLKFKKVIG
ncbi:hypothetical protein [Pseudoalteromonas sp. Of7M-16]|uniref:hypothetical protein n=1 Tax=Pseudoalteromonas sp. Of7M-16 TaxID=2917756 RepID=UPI001EF56350|nr:hypothetical protein [Pseudoalteromonas sp. Of7M-16]MCG7547386.1 hypothetical protein [Pseudoalteromonas sp. Of7M-16]